MATIGAAGRVGWVDLTCLVSKSNVVGARERRIQVRDHRRIFGGQRAGAGWRVVPEYRGWDFIDHMDRSSMPGGEIWKGAHDDWGGGGLGGI